jgi:hypothetical protein
MAEQKPKEAQQTVEPPPADSGVGERQVKPIQDRTREEQAADLTTPGDVKKGVLQEPEHEIDQSPYPSQTQVPPQERPPFATGRPDVPIVQSAVTGAGAHTPPDPDEYAPDGRPRDLT